MEKRSYAEQLHRSTVLAAEARRRGLHEEPVVRRRIREALVGRLIERLRGEIVPASITDGEVIAYRDAHRERFEEPARCRVGQVVLGSSGAAETLRSELVSVPVTERLAQFRAAAARESLDVATRDRGGDLGYVHAASGNVTPAIRAAALRLEAVGDLVVVSEQRRYVVIMKTGSLPARVRPSADVTAEIRALLLNERRHQAVEDLVRRLQAEHPFQVSDEELARITAPEGPTEAE